MTQGNIWKDAPGRHSHYEDLKSSYQPERASLLEFIEVGPNMEDGADDIKETLTVTQNLMRDMRAQNLERPHGSLIWKGLNTRFSRLA